MSNQVAVTITRQDRYRFIVDFGGGLAPAMADEPPPLGTGAGPSPTQLLAATVANCLAASLVFANAKFKADLGRLTATATCAIGRNERNRLRVTGIKVDITLGVSPESLAQLDRALAQFEDFCTVSQSVKAGIPLTVTVAAPDGRVLKS
ncbi:MAG: OsmC family protein [Alphaproteobacteria bacterium]|nr:OsmC family protein [Alphaproteobacteria bacterium]